ncbi:hypothetical protein PI125_g10922 [Phytophthora idaei]|nr:hypothetical protein PI125_g10922 [Phytophthora idaei]
MHRRIEALLAALRILQSRFPSLKVKLSATASIVHSPTFEAAVVKVINGEVARLTTSDRKAVKRFEVSAATTNAGSKRKQRDDEEEKLEEDFASSVLRAKKCEIPLISSGHGRPRSLAVRIQQFHVVCAVSSTIYMVQGETLDNMVVTEWRSRRKASNKRQEPYLLVSRVTSRDAFTTLSPLTQELIQWARPPEEAFDEEQRLLRLSDKTLNELRK